MDDAKPAIETPASAIVPVEPDWNAIREKYLQGEELAGIAAEFGTTVNAISCQAYRNKWKDAQARLLLKDEALLSKEIRANILVSVLKESKLFQRMEPCTNPIELDLWSKIRDRLVSTASRLLHWDADPVGGMKQIKPSIDV